MLINDIRYARYSLLFEQCMEIEKVNIQNIRCIIY
jgi:hypothetical protein